MNLKTLASTPPKTGNLHSLSLSSSRSFSLFEYTWNFSHYSLSQNSAFIPLSLSSQNPRLCPPELSFFEPERERETQRFFFACY